MVLVARRMLKEAIAVGEVSSITLKHVGVLDTMHTVEWAEGVSVGEIVIETDSTADPLFTVTFSGTAPKRETFRVEGPHRVLQHRITVPVEGGSVSSIIDGSA